MGGFKERAKCACEIKVWPLRPIDQIQAKFDLIYFNLNETRLCHIASMCSGQGRVNPNVAVVFRNVTNIDASVMIILTDQIFLMPNDQNREMPLRSTVSCFFAVKDISAKRLFEL